MCASASAQGVVKSIAPDQVAVKMERAQIGFGRNLGDEEIVALLKQHKLAPRAAKMLCSGLSGTHRAYGSPSAEAFLKEARSVSQSFFEDAIIANGPRIQDFVDAHTESEFVRSAPLQSEARSLLNIRNQLMSAVEEAKSGHAIIFATEVEGVPAQIERLRRSPKITTFIGADELASAGARSSALDMQPVVVGTAYVDEGVLNASPQDLYALLWRAASVPEHGDE